jgi:hypothetical protein
LQLHTKRIVDLICRSSQIFAVEAIFSISIIGALVTGFDLETTFRLALVCAVASIAGIFLLSPLRGVSKEKIPELIAKGIGIGIPAAALSHQLFLHSVLRPIGWLMPTLIAVPRMVAHVRSLRKNSETEPPNYLIDLIAFFTFSVVAIMTNGWWFLMPPAILLVGVLCMKYVSVFHREESGVSDKHQTYQFFIFGSLFTISIVVARYLAGLKFDYFFRSFDQLFRSALAMGLNEWGANDHIAAVGTPLRYHWVAEASVGLIAKLSGSPTLPVFVRFAPFLFTFAASAALWSLAKRFQLSHAGMALAFGSILWLDGIFRTIDLLNVRNPLGFALFFLFLGVLSDYQTSIQRIKILFGIALLCPLILMVDTPMGVLACLSTILIGLFNIIRGGIPRRAAVCLLAIGPLSILLTRISILKPNSDTPQNPTFGLNNLLQFGKNNWDIYSGQSRWWIALVSVALLSIGSFRWVGIFGPQKFALLLHAPHITCLAPALAGFLLANTFSFDSVAPGFSGVFLIGLIALPLLSADAITRELALQPRQFSFWLPAVLLGVCFGFLLHHAFELEPGNTRKQTLLSVMIIPIAILLVIRMIEWISRRSNNPISHQSGILRQGVQIAILVSLVSSSSFGMFVGLKTLTRSNRDVSSVLGNTLQLECLTWIRQNTPKNSIVVSNLWKIPLPSQDPKYFLVSYMTERRVLIDGPLFLDNSLSDWVADRMNWSEEFIDTPSKRSFEYMKSMNVSVVYMDFQYSTNRILEPFATTAFVNDACLVAKLK